MLNISTTKSSPSVSFDTKTGVLNIAGRSLIDNTNDFYKPIIDKITEYTGQPQKETIVNIRIDYFNTTSSKYMYDLLCKLETISKITDISINWYYEKDDEDIRDLGQHLQNLLDVPFNIIEVNG